MKVEPKKEIKVEPKKVQEIKSSKPTIQPKTITANNHDDDEWESF